MKIIFVYSDQLDRREGIHTSVHTDVASVFKGKTYTQLIALEKQIYSKISSGDAVDIGKICTIPGHYIEYKESLLACF